MIELLFYIFFYYYCFTNTHLKQLYFIKLYVQQTLKYLKKKSLRRTSF